MPCFSAMNSSSIAGDGLRGEPLLGLLDGAEHPRPWRPATGGGRRRARAGNRRRRSPASNWSKSSPPRCVSPWLAEHLHDAALDLHDRDVEGAAAEVVDQQPFHLVGMRVVGERGGGRLVDDPHDLQAGQLAGLAGRLALRLVEEGGHGDDGLVDRAAKLLFGPLLERPQDEGRDFLRRVFLVAQADGFGRAHAPLDRPHGPLGGQDPLVAGRGADEQAAVGVQADDRGQDRLAVLAQDFRFAVADNGHLAVGGAQVDSENGFHGGSGSGGETHFGSMGPFQNGFQLGFTRSTSTDSSRSHGADLRETNDLAFQ